MIRETVLSVRVDGTGQRVDYLEHLRVTANGDHTLRVHIHNDSYADQSFGKVERWSGAQWFAVASINGNALKTTPGIGYDSALTERQRIDAFRADRDDLVRLAGEVLTGGQS